MGDEAVNQLINVDLPRAGRVAAAAAPLVFNEGARALVRQGGRAAFTGARAVVNYARRRIQAGPNPEAYAMERVNRGRRARGEDPLPLVNRQVQRRRQEQRPQQLRWADRWNHYVQRYWPRIAGPRQSFVQKRRWRRGIVRRRRRRIVRRR